MDFLLCHPRPTPKVFRPHNYDEYRVDLYGLPGDAPGDLLAAYVQLGAVFKEADVTWCPIGEVCWNMCASVRNYYTAFSFMQTDCYPLGSRICMDDINLDNLLLPNPDFCISFRELVEEWHSTVPFRASKSTSSLTSLPLSMASSANPYRNSFFGTYQTGFLCRASPRLCVG